MQGIHFSGWWVLQYVEGSKPLGTGRPGETPGAGQPEGRLMCE